MVGALGIHCVEAMIIIMALPQSAQFYSGALLSRTDSCINELSLSLSARGCEQMSAKKAQKVHELDIITRTRLYEIHWDFVASPIIILIIILIVLILKTFDTLNMSFKRNDYSTYGGWAEFLKPLYQLRQHSNV